MKRIALFTIFLTALATTYAQTEVRPYSPGVTTDGVVYCLPKTAMKIAVTASRITKHPGDFHNYARHFLRVNDAIDKQQTIWTITKVQIIPYAVADTSKTYVITLKKNTSAPLCTLSDDGILLSVNAKSEQPKVDEPQKIDSNFTNKIDSRRYLNEEILAAGSELKMAELTAAEIYNIRDSRSELTKGEADYMPKDGEQLRLMLAKLDEQDKALTQLFCGYTDGETKTWVVDYIPQPNKNRDVLVRFSSQKGVIDADDLSGDPVYINITNKKTVPMGRTAITDKKLVNKVLFFNVPSQAEVELSFQGQSLIKQELPIAQFGHEEYLSEDLFNKRSSCHIWLNPLTGNISKIEDDTVGK